MTLQITENKNITTTNHIDPVIIEKLIVDGDMSQLQASERLSYYHGLCSALGLNSLTRPFEYLKLQSKLILYAKKDATEQLRKLHKVSVTKLDGELLSNGLYRVTAHVETPDGRSDISTGVVSSINLKGNDLANAFMKAETKAKRRATLSICGLGIIDESEIETIRGAVRIKDVSGVLVEEENQLKPVLLEKKAQIGLIELQLEDVLTSIRESQNEEELQQHLATARKSNLVKNPDSSEAIRQEKETWYINRSV